MWILLRPHYLFYTYLSLISAFFYLPSSSWKAFQIYLSCSPSKWLFSKWIRLPQFSLYIHSGLLLRKISKQFPYISISTFLIFSVIWLRMMRLKYNSFDADIGIQIIEELIQIKRKPTEKYKFRFCCPSCWS